jgi:hypothetical protein
VNLFDLFRRKPPVAWPRMAQAYLRGDQILMCAQARTTAGVWIWAEPFFAVDAADHDGLGEALRLTLNASRAQVPHPPGPHPDVTAPMLELAGVRSFKAFAAGARCVQIARQDGRITFTPTRNGGPGEGFIDLREQSLTAEEPDDPVVALLAAFDAST